MAITDKSNAQRANRSGSDGHTRPTRGGRSLRRPPLRASALLAIVLAVPAAAQATVITQTADYGPTKTNWSNIALNFAGFNSSLGSLQSVKLSVTELLSGTATGTNNASSSENTSFTIQNSGVVVNSGAGINIKAVNAKTTPTVTIASGATAGPFQLSGSGSQSQIFTSSLGFFESPYTLTASDSGLESLSGGGGNITAKFTDTGQVRVKALYTYGGGGHPVPSPGSLSLFGAGLLGLAWFASRKRQRRS